MCIMKMLYIRMVDVFNINVGQKIIPCYYWLFEQTDRQRPTLMFVSFCVIMT